MAIVDYDRHNEDQITGEDFIFKLVKKYFVLNIFLAIFTSFSFPKLPSRYEINNKSSLQFVNIRQFNFQNLKRNILTQPFNSIQVYMSNEVMKYKLYLNKEKYKS